MVARTPHWLAKNPVQALVEEKVRIATTSTMRTRLKMAQKRTRQNMKWSIVIPATVMANVVSTLWPLYFVFLCCKKYSRDEIISVKRKRLHGSSPLKIELLLQCYQLKITNDLVKFAWNTNNFLSSKLSIGKQFGFIK